jgi:hypothetical protein
MLTTTTAGSRASSMADLFGTCTARSQLTGTNFGYGCCYWRCRSYGYYTGDMGWPDLLVSDVMVMMAADDCRG